MPLQLHSVHDWTRFIKPEELVVLTARHGLKNEETKGFKFAGFGKSCFRIKIGCNPTIAYIGYAVKASPGQSTEGGS